VVPASGPAGTEITISGRDFPNYAECVFYWDSPETPIDVRHVDDIGQIQEFTYVVPESASFGIHHIVVTIERVVVVQEPFAVTR
jgi:hypothetical protein